MVNVKAPKPMAAAQVGTVETTPQRRLRAWWWSATRRAARCACAWCPTGYKKNWHVQFPKDIREAGARYVVEGVRESARGEFYRAYGDIKKLVN